MHGACWELILRFVNLSCRCVWECASTCTWAPRHVRVESHLPCLFAVLSRARMQTQKTLFLLLGCWSGAKSCLTLCNLRTAARQTYPFFTISQSSLKFMSIESMIPSNHLIFCQPLFLMPSIFPSIKVFSNELALHIRWPKYWSFSFSISPSKE